MPLIKLHPKDNVAVAVEELSAGQTVELDGAAYLISENVPMGHKIALEAVPRGGELIKYGFSIGRAKEPIARGSYVHTHNVKTGLGENLEYSYQPEALPSPPDLFGEDRIQAYKRENGAVAVRNELWIIPMVGCINGLADRIAEIFKSTRDLSHTDGLYVWKHPFGCSQLGDDLASTQRVLASLATHPHGGGVLLLGLGCENNTIELFRDFLGAHRDSPRIRFLAAQEAGDEIEEACALLDGLSKLMEGDRRQDCSLFELKIGLKCGGSDAFSGITANPLLGRFADAFARRGGCLLMTEVPEMFGAETILMNRAENPGVFGDIVALINDFKSYYHKNGQPIYENPSPGNKAGGITTLEDKSLGCTQKGGRVPVAGVLKYACQAPRSAKNLWLVEGPGNDQIAVTNLGAAGANIILFSTGRGTPFGGFVPTVKVSSNSGLAARKKHWIDFDAGRVLESGDFSALTRELGAHIRAVAEGAKTNNELYGSREISIFKKGVVL